MKHKVNISLQILPSSSSKHPYDIIDKAIEVISRSGLTYKVCPFETVMEGDYDKIMAVIREVQIKCLEFGAEKIFSNIKMQVDGLRDVTIGEKTVKYEKREES